MARKNAPQYGTEERRTIEPSGRIRRRTEVGADQPQRGRRLFLRPERDRQGTSARRGNEPSPRLESETEPYGSTPERREPEPAARGAGRGKRFAWGIGALTAAGIGTGAWFFRRRSRQRTMRRY